MQADGQPARTIGRVDDLFQLFPDLPRASHGARRGFVQVDVDERVAEMQRRARISTATQRATAEMWHRRFVDGRERFRRERGR